MRNRKYIVTLACTQVNTKMYVFYSESYILFTQVIFLDYYEIKKGVDKEMAKTLAKVEIEYGIIKPVVTDEIEVFKF